MRKIILGTLAAVALTLGVAATPASAAWVTGPVTTWDASCGRYVTTTQTYWVPDPVCAVPYRHHEAYRGYYHGNYRGHVVYHGRHHR